MMYYGNSQIIFKYELSSISVVYHNERPSFLDFLINLCAIIGGFITVSSIIDSLLRNLESIQKKGKIQFD